MYLKYLLTNFKNGNLRIKNNQKVIVFCKSENEISRATVSRCALLRCPFPKNPPRSSSPSHPHETSQRLRAALLQRRSTINKTQRSARFVASSSTSSNFGIVHPSH
uniref:(northern house mosquito) hypothetical protein n=1 Tax=Culex pipiens TaxID=7175 RepID=A0A8D8NUE6_CULPI